jgi:hypothetical protein
MEAANTSQPMEISRVAVKLPPFWAERPTLWFNQAASQFALAGITDERTKFHHIVSQLEQRYAAEVEDIINAPPSHEPYTKLRAELIKRLSPSQQQCSLQLLSTEAMGDRKPSQFLRHLRSLAPDMPDLPLRTIWSRRLPTNIQTTLACHPDLDLDAAADRADRITDIVATPALASTDRPATETNWHTDIQELKRQVATLRTARNPPSYGDHTYRSRSRYERERSTMPRNRSPTPRIRRRPSRSPPANNTPSFCWYHQRFGDRARDCFQPCNYTRQGN